ncbi:hypothetical protein [Posidoniimonas corsicana]|uniref:hypothetical protein n=1 Tax=Posidoniimonas corsicana TaxID=1938618 RepID=UPI001E286204|nr:hypothetical protein [Posidoniimonas corsicana]
MTSCLPVHAQNFLFRWDAEQDEASTTSKWEDPVNWFDETTNANHNSVAPHFIPETDTLPAATFDVAVRNGGAVDFDDQTSLALAGAADAPVVIQRFFLGAPGAGSGSGTLNVSGGILNAGRSGAGIVTTIGRAQDGTLNISGGQVNVGHRVFLGSGVNGHGEINLSGGEFVIFRGGNSAIMTPEDITAYGRPSFELGADDGDSDPLNSTTGVFNISGGAFSTRAHIAIGKYGTIDVQGSAASQIGIGSNGSLDGGWLQYAGGTLRAGVDAGGITPILIDDVDDDGQGDVRFASGSLLDPYDLGGALQNVWHTVMQWDGTLVENGLSLTPTAIGAGWEMQVLGNLLQVRLPGEGGGLPGDYNSDGVVDAADYTVFRDNLGLNESALNGNGTGDPSGNVVAADYNLWRANYGASTAPSAASAAPEPASTLLLAAGVALMGQRRRQW